MTLGRLAERAGVTKPVVYDHFETRNGLLAALYKDYDLRQTAMMDAALASCEPTPSARARVIASAYVGCVLTEGREIPGVRAALAGAPEMDALKRGYQAGFIARCRAALQPHAEEHCLTLAAFWGILGAADALSDAAARGDITEDEAVEELYRIILATACRG
ncbi:TetR/AcrR family transcriptional regulator [Azospirillum thermophilum]|uniref:TetR/AcrR family transcriptional regulator n=1 Tax=Azospirillum thermophilum TaxID=2202148 RepID=UPI001FEAC98F|nr:TetR/AcrR family transcriptional regulator [Azospirillum thermophilum]